MLLRSTPTHRRGGCCWARRSTCGASAARGLKTSAIHDRLVERGAVFGERFGWERPLWFSRNGDRDEYSMRRGNWHDAVGEECRAVRSAVGVLDQTSFAKYRVSGPGAEAFLDRLCANLLPELGRIEARSDGPLITCNI